MSIELFGFVAGIAAVCGAGSVLLRHELRLTVRRVYGSARPPARNALIWPSR